MTTHKATKACADILQAIAEQTRIRILDCLRAGEKSVTEVATLVKTDIVNVSLHLGVIRNAGVVRGEKRGRFVVYPLSPDILVEGEGRSTLLDLGWCWVEIPQQ